MCLETEFSEMSNGAASPVTRAGLRASRFRMARRVGSASATSVRSWSVLSTTGHLLHSTNRYTSDEVKIEAHRSPFREATTGRLL